MKKLMLLAVVFFAFVSIAFAQSGIRMYYPQCGDLLISGTDGSRQRVTDRVSSVAVGLGSDGSVGLMMIIIQFNDGSKLSYTFTSPSQGNDGVVIWNNVKRTNPITGEDYPDSYTGTQSKLGGAYFFSVIPVSGSQGAMMLAVTGL